MSGCTSTAVLNEAHRLLQAAQGVYACPIYATYCIRREPESCLPLALAVFAACSRTRHTLQMKCWSSGRMKRVFYQR